MGSGIKRQQHRDADRRTWTVALVPVAQAEAEDARYWYEELTPEERVEAVFACVRSSLKAQGIERVPRLRRVARRIERSRR